MVGGPCDVSVTPVPIGLGFKFLPCLGVVLGLGGLDLGLGLDNNASQLQSNTNNLV